MNMERDVMEVALEAGQKVMLQASGDPGRVLSVSIAAAITVVSVGACYGACKLGKKFQDFFDDF